MCDHRYERMVKQWLMEVHNITTVPANHPDASGVIVEIDLKGVTPAKGQVFAVVRRPGAVQQTIQGDIAVIIKLYGNKHNRY